MTISRQLQRGGFILLITMILANALNYLFQFAMGRMLTVEEFGTMNALFSWIAIVSLPIGVVTTTTARYIATYSAQGETEKIVKFFRRLIIYILLGAIGVLIFGIALSPIVSRYSNVNDTNLIFLVALTLAIGMFLPVFSGVIQGTKQFIKLGTLNLGLTVIKLALGILLVWLGFRLYGVMTALIISNFVISFVGLYIIKDQIKQNIDLNREDLVLGKQDIGNYVLIAFIINLCIAVLSNVDMVMVKRFFTEAQAGFYGTASLFGRLVLYIPSALVLAMFPIAAEAEASGGGSRSVLTKALIYVGGLSALIAAGLNLFTGRIVVLLMGVKFLPAVRFVRMTAVMAVPVGLMVTLANYSMAIKKMRLLTVSMAVGVIGCVTAIEIYHPSIATIIIVVSITASLLFVFNLVYLLKT
jgi:O-antigen/teichoic acid export membrane protein